MISMSQVVSQLPRSSSASLHGLSSGMMDGSGTINPAALNAAGSTYPTMLPPTPSSGAPGSRGHKRSRSPDDYDDGHAGGGDADDAHSRKRRGPHKPGQNKIPESPSSRSDQPPAVQTPQLNAQPLPQASPAAASPPARATPAKQPVVKALPTVRDHTTDQLNPEGDEYIPREFDEAGERKVAITGHLQDGREYRCRTFFVPNRGNKLFMLATECARVLGYRDSYLLFNKNRSLHKIIAMQSEKDDLIQQEILPYSYRSRQIAIVTARSMFRQFGSRVVQGGRRVRDDYWESKARKQGFTEEDAAGEKRPGAARAREAAQVTQQQQQQFAHANLSQLPPSQVIYNGGMDARPPLPEGVHPVTLATTSSALPMIDERRPRDYFNVPRPRQEMTSPPYQDRTQASSAAEILHQAAHAADFNKALAGQRSTRKNYLEELWGRPLDPQFIAAQRPPPAEQPDKDSQQQPAAHVGSPHQNLSAQQQQQPATSQASAAGASHTAHAQSQPPHSSQHQPQSQAAHPPGSLMGSQTYGQPMSSPARGPQAPTQQQMRPSPVHQSPMSMQSPGPQQHPGYGYPPSIYMQQQQQQQQHHPGGQQGQQGQPSPLHQAHGLPQYGQPSPHPQSSPLRGPPQMHSMYQNMQYPSMGGYPPNASPGQQHQQTPGQPQGHYLPHTSAGGGQPGIPQWPPQQPGQQGQPGQHGGMGQPGWGQGY